MILAIRDATLFQAGFDDLCPGLHALGLEAAEVALTRNLTLPAPVDSLRHGLSVATPEGVAAAAAAYQRGGCTLCALFLPTNFNAPQREPEVAWTVAAVRLAASVGVGVVRVDGAMSGPDHLSREQRVELYLEAVESVLAATAGAPVRLAIENHGRQGNELPWLEEVLERTDPARVGLTLDPSNLYWAGLGLAEVYATVERLAPRVCHVHVKNVTYPARAPRDLPAWEYGRHVAPIPEGDLDYRRLIGLLRAAGYSGALSLEDESLATFPPAERPELLRRAVEYLREAAG
jgi:sugar phosphate isomerase/epimerase